MEAELYLRGLSPESHPSPVVPKRRDHALLRVVERHVLPRLVLQTPALVRPERFGDGLSDQVDGLAQLALASDTHRSRSVLHRLHESGASFVDLQLGLLAPAARRLDEMWRNDEVSFLDVTLAVGALLQLMHFVALDLASPARTPHIGRSILIAPAPGEGHVFGATMAAEFFRRDGWNVLFEARPSAEDLVTRATQTWTDVLGLSLSGRRDLCAVRAMIEAVRAGSRNPELLVIVGGECLAENPGVVAEIGADAGLAALEIAPARAHRLVDALCGGGPQALRAGGRS